MKLLDLQHIEDSRGSLDILEENLDFSIKRVFTITAPGGAERGGHKHKKCQMILICSHGSIEVIVNNGSGRRSVFLDRPNQAIFLDPVDWHIMRFLVDSVLVVLASEKFDSEDYVYNEY